MTNIDNIGRGAIRVLKPVEFQQLKFLGQFGRVTAKHSLGSKKGIFTGFSKYLGSLESINLPNPSF